MTKNGKKRTFTKMLGNGLHIVHSTGVTVDPKTVKIAQNGSKSLTLPTNHPPSTSFRRSSPGYRAGAQP